MSRIELIRFFEKDKDVISQSGIVSIDEFKSAGFEETASGMYPVSIDKDISLYEEGSISSGIPFKGTTKTLEEMLKANQVAYSVLEREVIKDVEIEGIIGKKGRIDVVFISVSSSLLFFSLSNVLIYFLKNTYIINPFYFIFIIIGSIGWLLTSIIAIRSGKKQNGNKEVIRDN